MNLEYMLTIVFKDILFSCDPCMQSTFYVNCSMLTLPVERRTSQESTRMLLL